MTDVAWPGVAATGASPLVVHTVLMDMDGDGVIEGDGTVGALQGRTVGSLAGLTVAQLDAAHLPSREIITDDVRLEPTPQAERGRDRVASGSPPMASEVNLAVDNRSGNWSPGNPNSPLYQAVKIGRMVDWRIVAGGITYGVVQGLCKEIAPDSHFGQELVHLRGLSQLSRLVGLSGLSSPLYGDGTVANGVRTDQALGYVLDAAGLTSTSRRSFDAGDTRLLYFYIKPSDDLFDLALRLWGAEGPGSRLYDRADGVTVFTRRGREITDSRATTVQATFRDTDDGSTPYYSAWSRRSGEESMVNSCAFSIVRRGAAQAVEWRAGAVLTLQANELRDTLVGVTGDDVVANAADPVAGTDYTVTGGSLTLAPAIVGRRSGAFVTLRAQAGAGGATVAGPPADQANGLRVNLSVVRVSERVTVADAGTQTAQSHADYGLHGLSIPVYEELDKGFAQSLCDAWVARGMEPRPTALIELPLVEARQLAPALAREIGDRVAIVSDRDYFNRSMWVESITTLVDAGGTTTIRLGCEAVHETDYLRWGVGLWGRQRWGL